MGHLWQRLDEMQIWLNASSCLADFVLQSMGSRSRVHSVLLSSSVRSEVCASLDNARRVSSMLHKGTSLCCIYLNFTCPLPQTPLESSLNNLSNISENQWNFRVTFQSNRQFSWLTEFALCYLTKYSSIGKYIKLKETFWITRDLLWQLKKIIALFATCFQIYTKCWYSI